ncbi:MAG TPA: hypothetical protein VEQ37_00270 [Actinomycetota bacterium]|nr:hypothetical protein [Actinomycetota bacterium]
MTDRLDRRTEIEELLRRQDELQAEAATVRQDLGFDHRLSAHGEVVPVGSPALGLMVWRDLDFTVVCPRLDVEAVVRTGAGFARHRRVREVRFINDTGEWNTDPTYPAAYTWACRPTARPGKTGRWIFGSLTNQTANPTWPTPGTCQGGSTRKLARPSFS